MATESLLNAIKEQLEEAFKKVIRKKQIYKHAGKFNWTELRKRSFSAPALFITCTGYKEIDSSRDTYISGADISVMTSLAIGVVCKSARCAESRNAAARNISEALTLLIKRNDWGLELAGSPKDISANGVFLPSAEREGFSMWLVEFKQPFGLRKHELESLLDDLSSVDGSAQIDGETLIETQQTL